MVEPTMEPLAWLRKQLEEGDVDLLREIMATFVQALMGAETDALCGAAFGERSEEPVNRIVEAIRAALEVCPPELAVSVMDRGIVLTGGGALLRGLDERIGQEVGVPIHLAADPLHCVAIGSGRCLEDPELFERILLRGRSR